MRLTYWGHSCFLLETGTHRLVFDPFLTGNPKAAQKADNVQCDFVLLSHGHNDHFGDSLMIAKRNNAMIIANHEIATYCQSQGAKAHAMHLGGAWKFPFGKVKLTIAHHGSSLQTDQGVLYMGNPAGIIVDTGGKILYHAGDTALFMDMQLIGQLHKIDVALLPIGDNFTMGIDDAVMAAKWLKAKTYVPMHYKTFDLIDVDPIEFGQKLQAKGMHADILKPGASLEF